MKSLLVRLERYWKGRLDLNVEKTNVMTFRKARGKRKKIDMDMDRLDMERRKIRKSERI